MGFEDKSNRVVLHEDGVFEIFSLKYGMAVLADHEAVEVKTFQWALRNLACGLCGDMNDEKTADLKSAGKCVMCVCVTMCLCVCVTMCLCVYVSVCLCVSLCMCV